MDLAVVLLNQSLFDLDRFHLLVSLELNPEFLAPWLQHAHDTVIHADDLVVHQVILKH